MEKRSAMKKHLILAAALLVFLAPARPQTLQGAAGRKLNLDVLPRASVTVLVDNMAGSGPVLGEWGAAFLLETDQHQILVDTGGGRVLLGNASALNVNLRKTEAIVISHEHADHTQGLEDALNACGSVDLFLHPAGFETRYWKEGTSVTAHRLPLSREQMTKRVRKLIETRAPTVVRTGVIVTGQIPRMTDFEDTGVREYAFLDQALKTPDPIVDDQAVFFRVPEGVVIVLGCGHAGLINTMRYVGELVGEHRIYAVIGGTHLLSASPLRLQKTIEALREYGVQRVMLSHCTGMQAYAALSGALPGRCAWPASGTRIRFGGQQP
jgi:7,8-dihydropterin-6-yl-methyl-4-(beta-D-ribofuranosyl)aminobenzene 5'-phosphate synthase